MSLTELQRAFVRVCLAEQPAQEDLARLGLGEGQEPWRWAQYRVMVRERLHGLAVTALPRTSRALGEAAFRHVFERFLAELPPTTPYLRDVVGQFVDYAAGVWRQSASVPPFLLDLVTFERVRWDVGYAPAPLEGDIAEFDFQRPIVLSAAHRLLRLTHAVHEEPAEGAANVVRAERVNLCVYRRTDTHATGWWVLNDVAADLVAAWGAGSATAGEAVRQVAEARGIALDAAFFEGLADVVAGLIERGVVLGSR